MKKGKWTRESSECNYQVDLKKCEVCMELAQEAVQKEEEVDWAESVDF